MGKPQHTKRTVYKEDVTIGWICATPKELLAARSMLDEDFEWVQQRADDPNSYVVGRIARHNIVIATLDDTSDPGAAARTAAHLVCSFPRLRCGLMVGIAGGVPAWGHDIRLGDVVVSHPEGLSSGLVAFDVGKATDGTVQYRGQFNRAPECLLNAAINLESERGLKEYGDRITEIMEKANERLLDSVLPSPHESTDVLICSKAMHDESHNPSACILKCDPSRKVANRSARTSKFPRIHRGIIASSHKVIADECQRDAIVEDVYTRTGCKILAFDMEAASLANTFRCLIIRGISDYADSEKGDVWQPYAALSAAAYAKRILMILQPENAKQEKPVLDLPRVASHEGPEKSRYEDVLASIRQSPISSCNIETRPPSVKVASPVWGAVSSKEKVAPPMAKAVPSRQETFSSWMLQRQPSDSSNQSISFHKTEAQSPSLVNPDLHKTCYANPSTFSLSPRTPPPRILRGINIQPAGFIWKAGPRALRAGDKVFGVPAKPKTEARRQKPFVLDQPTDFDSTKTVEQRLESYLRDAQAWWVDSFPSSWAWALRGVHIAAGTGDLEILRHPTLKGHLQMRDERGNTPIAFAVAGGYTHIVDYLYDGADPSEDVSMWLGESPGRGFGFLHLAAWLGHRHVTKYLLDRRAPLERRASDCSTPLHTAVRGGHLAVVDLLLESGADLGARLETLETALHLATTAGTLDMVRRLIKLGHELEPRDSQGETPMHHAARANDLTMIYCLHSLESSAGSMNRNRKMPANLAEQPSVKQQLMKLVKLELMKG